MSFMISMRDRLLASRSRPSSHVGQHRISFGAFFGRIRHITFASVQQETSTGPDDCFAGIF
jgi:hypothetical protein